MANLNTYWYSVIIFFLIILFCTEKSLSQFATVQCYECTNCTDPFTANSSSVTITSSCNSCYKLAITIAYAPYAYVIRRCLEACLESNQLFAGGSVISTCCATTLCNASSLKTFSPISQIFLFIFIILNFIKSFH